MRRSILTASLFLCASIASAAPLTTIELVCQFNGGPDSSAKAVATINENAEESRVVNYKDCAAARVAISNKYITSVSYPSLDTYEVDSFTLGASTHVFIYDIKNYR